MAAVAAFREIDAGGFRVAVRMQASAQGDDGAGFENEITLSPAYSERERRILFNAARTCEVHHLLRGPITFREILSCDGEPAQNLPDRAST